MSVLPTVPEQGYDQISAAMEQGRICALAARGQRDLQRCVEARPDLFPREPFDAALCSNIALAVAFGAPWCTAEQLELTNRTVLWGFAVDWLVDQAAKSADEVGRLVSTVLAVADGAPPQSGQPLAGFLSELRDELACAPTFAQLHPVWREELRRMLAAMAREWDWRTATGPDGGPAPLPTFAEYLDNADNLAATFVNVTHWIHAGDAGTADHLSELIAASNVVQQVLRLVNDLGTYERDLRWGDLNALMLVADRSEVQHRIAALVDHARELLAPLAVHCPVQADYLARQIGFSSGFYRGTDFWGVR